MSKFTEFIKQIRTKYPDDAISGEFSNVDQSLFQGISVHSVLGIKDQILSI